jgi:hypothetical protein
VLGGSLASTRTQSVAPPARWLEALATASEGELAALLQMRVDLALARPENIAVLASGMVTPDSARMFHDNADRATRQVLEALCVLPSPAAPGAVASALGCQPKDLSPLLENLQRAGMVLLSRGGDIEVNPGLAGCLQWPCRLAPPIGKLLRTETNGQLMNRCRHLGLSESGNKEDLLKRLARALSDRDQLTSWLRSAPSGTAQLVDQGAHNMPRFAIAYSAAEMARRGNSAVGWCLQRGILVATSYDTAVMPREVALALRGGRLFPSFNVTGPALASRALDQEDVDGRAAEAALALVRDIETICETWSKVPATPLQAGGIGVKEIRRVAKQLGKPEELAARLVELASWAGFVELDDVTGWVAPTPAYDRWRTGVVAERWVELASCWMTLPVHLSGVGGKDAEGKMVPPLLDRAGDQGAMLQRALVTDVLAEAAAGTVSNVESVAEVAIWRRPATWPSARAGADGLVHWILAELTMVGLAASGDASSLALASFGRLLAEGDTQGATKVLAGLVPPVVDAVIFQADLTATAAGEPAPTLRAGLDLLADVESSGHATVWRFSEATLRRAFLSGQSAPEIKEFLEQHSLRGVPQALCYLVDDMGRRYGRARVGKASSYVRSDDASLLAEMQRDKRLARLRLRLLAPTVAVSSAAPLEVESTLALAGYLPAGEGPEGTIEVRRPLANRSGQAGKAPPVYSSTSRGWGPAALLDELRELKEPEETDEGFLAELMDDPEMLAGLTGLPADVAKMFLELAVREGPEAVPDVSELAARLKEAPIPAALAPSPSLRPSRSPAPTLSLLEDFQLRPTQIAKDHREVPKLLEEAAAEGWAVRLGYVNGEGTEREFYAQVLSCVPGRVRVRYLGERGGGGELATYRVQWARVLTEAEEQRLV